MIDSQIGPEASCRPLHDLGERNALYSPLVSWPHSYGHGLVDNNLPPLKNDFNVYTIISLISHRDQTKVIKHKWILALEPLSS